MCYHNPYPERHKDTPTSPGSDPRGQLNEGESERWNATVRSRQTLRGSVVLAVAGTKVTWSYLYPDGRFWDLRLEFRLSICRSLVRFSPLSQTLPWSTQHRRRRLLWQRMKIHVTAQTGGATIYPPCAFYAITSCHSQDSSEVQ